MQITHEAVGEQSPQVGAVVVLGEKCKQGSNSAAVSLAEKPLQQSEQVSISWPVRKELGRCLDGDVVPIRLLNFLKELTGFVSLDSQNVSELHCVSSSGPNPQGGVDPLEGAIS